MASLSSAPVAAESGFWEIWLSAPGDHRERFESGRLYACRDDAVRACSAMQDWFHLGLWSDAALDDLLPAAAQDDLFASRQGFKAAGTDLAAVRVTIKPVRELVTGCGPAVVMHDPDEDGDTSDDDTVTLTPDVLYLPPGDDPA